MTETELDTSNSSLTQWWHRYWNRAAVDDIYVELFVRSCAPSLGCHDHQAACLQGLSELAENGPIDGYEISVVGDEICRDEDWKRLYEGKPVEVVLDLSSWRSGGIRSTGFTECTIHSTITDETVNTVIPPEFTLAVYADDDVIGVFPCLADGECYGPDTFLEGCLSLPQDEDTDWQLAQD